MRLESYAALIWKAGKIAGRPPGSPAHSQLNGRMGIKRCEDLEFAIRGSVAASRTNMPIDKTEGLSLIHPSTFDV